LVFVLTAVTSTANAASIEPGQIDMLDGDTIRRPSPPGFAAPEIYRAR